jgi:hypothetical protein
MCVMSKLPAREKAVASLLQPPAVLYLRSLKAKCDQDPRYLRTNREDIGHIIYGFLIGSGFHWAHSIFEKEWPEILQEALARLGRKKR